MDTNQSTSTMAKEHKSPYGKFALILVISFCIMYAVMFLNVTELDHIYISMNRFYMALLMVSPMALIMMGMMGKMYTNKKINTIIVVSAIAVLGLAFAGLRTQATIGDVQYMKGMIPHHSSAIMTSSHADLKDPEVRKLADGIIQAQVKEIAEMKALLKKLGH